MSEYVSFSGGADSTAVALLLHERGVEFELVFSDTSCELPETLWFIPRFARQIGHKLIVLSNGSFYQHLANYGFMIPSRHARWCTRLLKQKPMNAFFTLPNTLVHIGIRADEAHRIRTKGDYKHDVSYPLVEAGMDKRAASALCKKYAALNPIYSWRSNCSCFCCPFQRVGDWRGLHKHHPDFFGLAEEWERLSMERSNGFTWAQGRTLRQIRLAQESHLCLFPEPEGEPCLICQA